jgi:hypothetical protein
MSTMNYHVTVSITPVKGGFIVSYPEYRDGSDEPVFVQEVATTSGKAMRIAKAAVEVFSLVTKSKDEVAEA